MIFKIKKAKNQTTLKYKKYRKYYKNYIKKLDNRCIDCKSLISFGNHLRCPKCQRFNLVKLSYIKACKFIKNNKEFLMWFVGFYEGEGNVKQYKRKLKNKIYEGYKLSVSQKEKHVLYQIKKVFNFGEVYSLGLKNVCSIWSTDNIGEIIALIKFMYPLLKSPRRKEQLKIFLKGKRINSIRKHL